MESHLLHPGINNLSSETIAAIAQRLGQGNLRTEGDGLATDDSVNPLSAPASLPAELLQFALAHGYANRVDAYAANTLWRPQLGDRSGTRINHRPIAPGPMSALVVGPDGQTSANGPDELWCDALGRVKIRFHWQQAEVPDDRDSCWVHVLNREAGPEMGWQWLPRGRLLTDPETSTWLSEKTWGEKGIEDALAEFMENKGFL